MATGAKMSFNYYQNGKFGTLPQNPGKDMEVSQDMHLKMSKKIAQLTKVIYALNTKNDEHEAVMVALKDQHEEQMQQLLAETKAKIEHYRQTVNNDSDYIKQIEVLQTAIQNHEKEKESSLRTFQAYKREAEAKENRMQTEHSEKLLILSQQVLHAKKDFEAKLDMLESIRTNLEQDKWRALQDLEERHKQAVGELMNSEEEQKGNLQTSKQQLEEKYKSEIEKLGKRVEELDTETKKISEDYEHKLNKAKAFYDSELEALKNSQNASNDERVSQLQSAYDKLKKDMAFQDSQNQKRINDLLGQLSLSEEESSKYKDQLDKLQDSLKNKDSNYAMLIKQLEDAKRESNSALTRLRQVETELAALTERCEQQAKDLFKKSTELGELEATKLQHESVIKDLKAQLDKLKDRLQWLEGAKRSLEDKSLDTQQEQGNHVKSLERALEEMSIDKQKMKEKLEREIKHLEETSKQTEERLKVEHQQNAESITQKLQNEKQVQQNDYEEKLAELRKELLAQLESERTKLNGELASLKTEYENTKADLSQKLSTAEEEIRRLERMAKESQSGLGSATSQVNSLKDMADRLKAELDNTRKELRSAKNKLTSVQAEYDKLKIQHESSVKEAATELKTKLDRLSTELDTKWRETLRKECEKLRRELTLNMDEDKRAALEQLSKMKDEEMHASRFGWEKKVSELLNEISSLKSRLQSQQMMTSDEMDKLKQEADADNRRLRQEMLDAAGDYSRKIEQMESLYKGRLESLEEQKDKAARENENSMKARHLEDMQAQMMAHKSTLESVRDSADKKRLAELDSQRLKTSEKLEELRVEMERKQAMEIEQVSRENNMALQAARMELQRAIDLSKAKEGDFAVKESEFEDTIRQREEMIRLLEEEVRKLQQGVNNISSELKAKGKEVLQIRSDATKASKAREEQLRQTHKDELHRLHAEHQAAVQEMLDEFTQAQELLKDKISELQFMLEEAEDRYRNRESRTEDLDLIKQLQQAIQEREGLLHKLQNEKKYYQQELVNRETNFNKVFTGDPKVGLINPLQVGKKKKGQLGKRTSGGSSPNIAGRLDPLPNSPMHDASLNNMRPLPPTTKKFMR